MDDYKTNLPVKALPKTRGEMLAARLNQSSATNIDLAENLILDNIGDAKLMGLLEATENAASITGNCEGDDLLAAQRLQELAAEQDITPLATMKLVPLKTVMRYALTRFRMTRQQRIKMARQELEAQAAARASATHYGSVVE